MKEDEKMESKLLTLDKTKLFHEKKKKNPRSTFILTNPSCDQSQHKKSILHYKY